MSVAGSNCQPYSPMGRRLGSADERHIAFVVWSQQQIAARPHFVAFENSSHFPTEVLVKSFRQVYICVYCIVCPSDMGWPIHRRRLLLFAFDPRKYRWAGPDSDDPSPGGPDPEAVRSEFMGLFRKKMEVSFEAFMVDSEQNIKERMQQVALSQKVYLRQGEEMKLNVRDVLSPSSRRHYDLYAEQFGKCGSRIPFICDLSQNPVHRNMCSTTTMPAFTTSSCRYCFSQMRFPTFNEMFAMHGWASLPAFAGARSLPFQMSDYSPTALTRMLGNGIALPPFAAFYAWCLSNLELRLGFEHVHRPMSAEPPQPCSAQGGRGDGERALKKPRHEDGAE